MMTEDARFTARTQMVVAAGMLAGVLVTTAVAGVLHHGQHTEPCAAPGFHSQSECVTTIDPSRRMAVPEDMQVNASPTPFTPKPSQSGSDSEPHTPRVGEWQPPIPHVPGGRSVVPKSV